MQTVFIWVGGFWGGSPCAFLLKGLSGTGCCTVCPGGHGRSSQAGPHLRQDGFAPQWASPPFLRESFCESGEGYVAPIGALSGPVLRDTARLSQRYPPSARYGVFGVSTWPIGCDTPSPFSEHFPLGEHAKWRCDTPPPKGYLSDTCAIPYENKANGCDTPLCDTISKGYCAIWGGISHWAAWLGAFFVPACPPLTAINGY